MKTFLMYGPEERDHIEFVRHLAEDLLARHVDCELDVLARTPAEGWRAWTDKRAADADVVLLVLSPAFSERIEAASRAAPGRALRHDARLVAGLLAATEDGERKVVVVLPDGAPEALVPRCAAEAQRFRYPAQADELAARLCPQPTAISAPNTLPTPSAPVSSKGVSHASQPHASQPRPSPPVITSRAGGTRDTPTPDLLRTYLQTLVATYERNDGAAPFVRPSGESSQGVAPDLVAHLRAVLARDRAAMVLLLGEYGSGKTYAARRLAYELARDALSTGASEPIIPFYMSLSFARNKASLVRALSLFIGRYDVRLSEASLLELFTTLGRVVLVLDGLDELGERITREETPRFLAALTELRAVTGLRVILTCRSTFFRESVDDTALNATETLAVRPFDDGQIAQYMAHAPLDAGRSLASVFERTPRLRELCRTPIDLLLTQEYVAERADIAADFRLIDLYDSFVRRNLLVHAGINPGWSPAARREFVRRLFYVMFDEGVFEMTLGDLERVLAPELPGALSAGVSQMAAQIANCSFFTRAGDAFRPLHLSFQEYFVADTLVADLYAGRFDKWNRRPLYAEIFDFMVQMIQRRGVGGLPVRAMAASEKEEAASNFLATLYRWPVPAVRSLFEELLLEGKFPLVRCVACQGVGIYDSPEVVPTLLAAFDQEQNGVIKAVVQRLLEHLRDQTEGASREAVQARLAEPVAVGAGDAEAILSTHKNKFALAAYRKALLLGDARPSSTIAAIYLLVGIGDTESYPAIASVAMRSHTRAIQSAYTHALKLAPLPPAA